METYKDFGFVKVAAAIPRLRVADVGFNTDEIISLLIKADNAGAEVVAFPELCLTGYTCGDLFHQHELLMQALSQLKRLAENTAGLDIVSIIGLPIKADNQLFNCAAVVHGGRIAGIVPKTYIPGYKEFYEERWFSPGTSFTGQSIDIFGQRVPFGTDILFETEDYCFGVEICEDLWAPIPPSSFQAMSGASVLFNISASNDLTGKCEYRRDLVRQQSGKCIAAYVYASAGVDESTTDVVFGGHGIIAENGIILAETERFARESRLLCMEVDVQKLENDRLKNNIFVDGNLSKVFRKCGLRIRKKPPVKMERRIDPYPFVPTDLGERDARCEEIFNIQTAGLAKRIEHTGLKKAVVGISGGLDSTLALLVTAKTFDLLKMPKDNIIAVTMPGFGTTGTTHENALKLIKSVGATLREIDIQKACMQHFEDIGHSFDNHGVVYENTQARERTQILMDIANMEGGLVVGTGDLSELALGWSTYNGDHMSMYSVNCSVPKTLVRYLVQWVADKISGEKLRDVLLRILDTPITPELLPPDKSGGITQKTEDMIGPYELHDFILYHMIRYGAPPAKILFLAENAFKGLYGKEEITGWLKVFYKRFFTQQFKRSCMPDGPKVGSISLSPRGDWRMPSDAAAETWLDGIVRRKEV
jgi:NAD+ synthase (glutamine-hydrolysing)